MDIYIPRSIKIVDITKVEVSFSFKNITPKNIARGGIRSCNIPDVTIFIFGSK